MKMKQIVLGPILLAALVAVIYVMMSPSGEDPSNLSEITSNDVGQKMMPKETDREEEITTVPSDLTANAISQEDLPTEADRVNQKTDILLYSALLFMAFATLVSIAISFYLYRWRRILLSQPNLLVPEEWGKYLDAVGKRAERLGAVIDKNIHNIASVTSDNTEKISNMIEIYMSLQSVLDAKDVEIRRLKKGYDAELFRRFLARFIRIDQAIDDYVHLDKCSAESFDQLKRLSVDALEECGIEIFSPEIGEDYRSAAGVADNPKSIATGNSEEEFMIAEVLEVGYRLRNSNDHEVIVPSKVKIYKCVEQE